MPVQPAPYLPYEERLARFKRLLEQWKEQQRAEQSQVQPNPSSPRRACSGDM